MKRGITALCLPALLGLLLVLARPLPCLACRCVFNEPGERFAWADVVFRGVVVGVAEPGWWEPLLEELPWTEGTGPENRARLQATEVWKGPQQSEFVVATNSSTCGITFWEGEEYLVYAKRREDGSLATSVCAGTISADHTAEYATLLTTLGPATPVPSDRVATPSDAGP